MRGTCICNQCPSGVYVTEEGGRLLPIYELLHLQEVAEKEINFEFTTIIN
jgi:hypothetical protein